MSKGLSSIISIMLGVGGCLFVENSHRDIRPITNDGGIEGKIPPDANSAGDSDSKDSKSEGEEKNFRDAGLVQKKSTNTTTLITSSSLDSQTQSRLVRDRF